MSVERFVEQTRIREKFTDIAKSIQQNTKIIEVQVHTKEEFFFYEHNIPETYSQDLVNAQKEGYRMVKYTPIGTLAEMLREEEHKRLVIDINAELKKTRREYIYCKHTHHVWRLTTSF